MSSVPMTKHEIGKRIDSINETRTASFGGVSVRYAYLSQRGYYPDGTFHALLLLQYYAPLCHKQFNISC